MSRDVRLYLEDILEECDRVLAFTTGLDAAGFRADIKARHAVAYALLSIGEAVKHVPPHLQAHAPTVPWSRISGLRDRLAHGYFATDPDIVWDVVRNHIPTLRSEVDRMQADVLDGTG